MANKKVKKVALKDTFAKITKTAKSVNKQIVGTSNEVVEDVLQNRKAWTAEATETAKKVVKEIKITNGFEQIKTTAKNINEYSLEAADGLVDAALENGKDWQVIAAKAMKGGLKLADKQQDIMFDTLETLKGQVIKSAGRFRNLFSRN